MNDLISFNEKVTEAISAQDGSWQKRKQMLDSIEALNIAAMGPTEYITRLEYQAIQNMCLVIALEMNLLKPILERKGQHVTADEIAYETQSEKSMVARIMRMLTALQICEEVSSETYISNANAESLASPGLTAGVKFLNRVTLQKMASVVPYMRSNGGRFIQFPDASKGEKALVDFTYGMSFWEYLRNEPEHLSNFNTYIGGRHDNLVGRWFDILSAKDLIPSKLETAPLSKGEALVVDVGGNVGYDLQDFQKRFPEYKDRRLVLQDLPENITKAKESLAGTGIECMEYDFFTPQPVKGARFYVFCGIFHDWPENEAKKILQTVAAAMDNDSTLIIEEMPLPDEKASVYNVTTDILMMISLCGIERTIRHWRQLLDECGLELKSVNESPVFSVLEAKLKQ